MTDVTVNIVRQLPRVPTAWDRLKTNRDWLGFWFMIPAAAYLILFLPIRLGSNSILEAASI